MSQIISEFVSTPSIEVMLLVGRAVALVLGFALLAWALSQWRRNAQRDTQRVFEQLDLVRSELLIMKEVMHDATHRGERGGERIGDRAAARIQFPTQSQSQPQAQSQFQPPVQPQPQFPMTAPVPMSIPGARGYEVAARMARNGATKEELIRSAGITPHEADLLVKLHSRERPASFTASAAATDSQPKAQQKNASPAAAMIGRQARPAANATSQKDSAQREAARTPPRPQAKVQSRLVAVG